MIALFRKKTPEAAQSLTEAAPSVTPTASPTATNTRSGNEGEARYAKGTTIRYDESLVDKLKTDHQELLAQFSEMTLAVEISAYDKCNEILGRFKARLTDHLLIENVKLYVFLDCHLESDGMNATLVRNFRQEMDKIGKVVMDFLRRYQKLTVSAANAAEFKRELAAIGNVLVDRINREEATLYSMYEMV